MCQMELILFLIRQVWEAITKYTIIALVPTCYTCAMYMYKYSGVLSAYIRMSSRDMSTVLDRYTVLYLQYLQIKPAIVLYFIYTTLN